MIQKYGTKAPLFHKKKGLLGEWMTLPQIKRVSQTSKATREQVRQEMQNRRDQILAIIQKLNSPNHNQVYIGIREIVHFDFFDVYALRSQINTRSILNSIAIQNVIDQKHSLKELQDYLVVGGFMESGEIAYRDWKHHHDLATSISILLKLAKRGDSSLSIRNFLCKVLSEKNVHYSDVSRYITKYYVGSKQQVVQVILCYLRQRVTTKAKKIAFIENEISDPAIKNVLRQYIVLQGTPEIYNIDTSILRQ